MTSTETPAARYRRLSARLTDRIDAVPADAWGTPSTCAGWTVRDVVRHLVDTERQAVVPVGLSIPDGPSVDDEPTAAWAFIRDQIQDILDDPERANLEYDGHFGRTDLASTISSFYCFDLIVHAWDIAHPLGLDDTIDDEDLNFVEGFLAQMGENIRMDGVCGPAVDVPADADRPTKVLAQLGRAV